MPAYDTRASSPRAGIRSQAGQFLPTRTSARPATTTYRHRARRTSTGALVYWSVTGAPDPTGAQSPYPGGVSDVVLLAVSTS